MKFLRKNSKRPTSNAIHNLRTSTGGLETTFITVNLATKRKVKRLLRDLARVRKRAGKVRDMDVLTADTLAVRLDGEQDCLVQLVEYLGAERNKYAKKLRFEIEARRPQLRRNLNRVSKRLTSRLKQVENNPAKSDAVPTTMAKAIRLASDLKSPVHLNKTNLHPYRLKVKELRNVLQLSDHTGNEEFLEKLGEVKDAIGEWHDWAELVSIAGKLLDHGKSCKLIRDLTLTSQSKYEHALSVTSQMRRNYLQGVGTSRKTRYAHTRLLSTPVLEATSAIAQP